MNYSKLGIASCLVFGLVVLCGIDLLIVVATTPKSDRTAGELGVNQVPWSVASFYLQVAGWGLSLIGFCLGFAGLSRHQQKYLPATAGTILNGLVAIPITIWLLYMFRS